MSAVLTWRWFIVEMRSESTASPIGHSTLQTELTGTPGTGNL